MILVPFDPAVSSDQILRIAVGGQNAKLRLFWNVRSEHWCMDLSGSFGEVLGLKLVPDWPLLRSRESVSTFEGDWIVRALTANLPDQTIRYSDLGVVWGLLWMTPDEKNAWEAKYGLE